MQQRQLGLIGEPINCVLEVDLDGDEVTMTPRANSCGGWALKNILDSIANGLLAHKEFPPKFFQ
jgi:hypothetical protein